MKAKKETKYETKKHPVDAQLEAPVPKKASKATKVAAEKTTLVTEASEKPFRKLRSPESQKGVTKKVGIGGKQAKERAQGKPGLADGKQRTVSPDVAKRKSKGKKKVIGLKAKQTEVKSEGQQKMSGQKPAPKATKSEIRKHPYGAQLETSVSEKN